jgi:hypothetical protein
MNPLDLYRREPFHIKVLNTLEEFEALFVSETFGAEALAMLDRVIAEQEGHFLVIGPRGTGKSTLFRYAQNTHPEHPFLFLEPPSRPSWNEVQQQAVAAWNREHPEALLKSLDDLPVVLELGQRLIVVLDDLEKIAPESARTLLLTAPSASVGNVLFLLGVEPAQMVEIASQTGDALRLEPLDVIHHGATVLQEVARRRLSLYEGDFAVTDEVLNECARLANGVVREFLRILQLLFRCGGVMDLVRLPGVLDEESQKHLANVPPADLQTLHRLFRGLEVLAERLAALERQHLIFTCPPDHRWETVWFVKHHLAQQERARQRSLQTLWQQAMAATDPYQKGDLFEQFVLVLVQGLDGVRVIERRMANEHEEYDLLVDVRDTRRLAAHAPFLFVECKNWRGAVGASELRNFGWKCLTKQAAFGQILGLLFAVNGVTAGAEAVLKEAAMLGIPLVVIDDVAALLGVELENVLDARIVAQKMGR